MTRVRILHSDFLSIRSQAIDRRAIQAVCDRASDTNDTEATAGDIVAIPKGGIVTLCDCLRKVARDLPTTSLSREYLEPFKRYAGIQKTIAEENARASDPSATWHPALCRINQSHFLLGCVDCGSREQN